MNTDKGQETTSDVGTKFICLEVYGLFECSKCIMNIGVNVFEYLLNHKFCVKLII